MRKHRQTYLEQETYKRVVSVARSYCGDLKKIKIIENDLIMSTSRPEALGGGSSFVSDPTYNVVQQIEKHTEVLRARTDAVEKAFRTLDEEEQVIIKANVLEGIPLIYCNTQKSERSMQRLRSKFLARLAVELGETF